MINSNISETQRKNDLNKNLLVENENAGALMYFATNIGRWFSYFIFILLGIFLTIGLIGLGSHWTEIIYILVMLLLLITLTIIVIPVLVISAIFFLIFLPLCLIVAGVIILFSNLLVGSLLIIAGCLLGNLYKS